MPQKETHVCEAAGYKQELSIEFFKETMSGWNWNLVYTEPDEPGMAKMQTAWHIKHCPFCGENLEPADEDKLRVELDKKDAEFLLDAVDTWTDSKHHIKLQLLKIVRE